MQRFAPGARVEIRDEDWVIRRVDRTTHQGYQLTFEGISELVRGKEALFLSDLENEIKVLDPKDTALVQDMSPSFFTRSFVHRELIAIFFDGYEYHHDCVHEDLLKRQSLLLS